MCVSPQFCGTWVSTNQLNYCGPLLLRVSQLIDWWGLGMYLDFNILPVQPISRNVKMMCTGIMVQQPLFNLSTEGYPVWSSIVNAWQDVKLNSYLLDPPLCVYADFMVFYIVKQSFFRMSFCVIDKESPPLVAFSMRGLSIPMYYCTVCIWSRNEVEIFYWGKRAFRAF